MIIYKSNWIIVHTARITYVFAPESLNLTQAQMRAIVDGDDNPSDEFCKNLVASLTPFIPQESPDIYEVACFDGYGARPSDDWTWYCCDTVEEAQAYLSTCEG